jgi:hypothetical protein
MGYQSRVFSMLFTRDWQIGGFKSVGARMEQWLTYWVIARMPCLSRIVYAEPGAVLAPA